jgi:hypothetical protein
VRGGLRGAVAAWLGLIALQAIATQGGSGRVAQAFTDVNRLVERALDPKVPAIPDRGTAAGAARSRAAGNAGPGTAMPVNPAAAAAADPAPRTRTDYPTNGMPFPAPAPTPWPSFNFPIPTH